MTRLEVKKHELRENMFYLRDGEFFSVKDTEVAYKLHVSNHELTVGYVIHGNEYNTLYILSDDTKSMVPMPTYHYPVATSVMCERTKRTYTASFDADTFAITAYKADGVISTSTYTLGDGEYTCTHKYGILFIDLGLTTSNFGFLNESDAKFFNRFTTDGKEHAADADKIVPTAEEVEAGLKTIETLFKTLEKQNLRLVIDTETLRLGIAKRMDSADYCMTDDSADMVPHDLAIAEYQTTDFLDVSECWGIKLLK